METTSTQPTTNPTHSYPPVYIGTYEDANSNSIFFYRLNPATGELIQGEGFKGGERPSYLAFNNDRTRLYAANEEEETGYVSSFTIDAASGKIAFLNKQPCPGAPCHLVADHTFKVLLVANYTQGSVTVFPIKEDGSLGPASDTKQHHGSSVNKDRQEKEHAHWIAPDPTNKYAFVIDLGMDKIMGYRLDTAKGTLTANDPEIAYNCKPGSGPRHLTFHPNEKYAYLINELDCTMTALLYDSSKGVFTEIQTISTLPEGFKEENTCAAVHMLPNGKVLYGSNRGHDSIVVYSIDESTGKLTFVEHVSTQGKGPRDFNIDWSGTILVAANQRSDNVVTFSINQETGRLTPTGHVINVPKPVCVRVIKDFC